MTESNWRNRDGISLVMSVAMVTVRGHEAKSVAGW